MNEPDEFVFSLADVPLYPHLKLTREAFPRVLATRLIENDGAEYFGAFLGRTSVRILIDFLNRVFRLRSCDVFIDGTFPVPCTQYFRKRCVAPCVAEICGAEEYSERVAMVRTFLMNDRRGLRKTLSEKIAAFAADLNFEAAATLRDIATSVEDYWDNPRWNVWLDDAVDTFRLIETGTDVRLFLVTQRGRHTLGSRIFEFPKRPNTDATRALHDVIAQFYRYHIPKEIRVSDDFDGRRKLSRELSARSGRPVKISVISDAAGRITAERALERALERFELERIKPKPTAEEIMIEAREIFGLPTIPRRIEAVDAAHISGSGFIAARAVWLDGKFATRENEFWISDQKSELDTIRAFVARRLANSPLPDLLVIDGGLAHVNAALGPIRSANAVGVSVIGAAKPAGRHSDIAYFIDEDRERIPYREQSAVMAMIKLLRDDAHDLANFVHRELRDARHFYDASRVSPLVVPIRFTDPDGGSDDLRPIVTRTGKASSS